VQEVMELEDEPHRPVPERGHRPGREPEQVHPLVEDAPGGGPVEGAENVEEVLFPPRGSRSRSGIPRDGESESEARRDPTQGGIALAQIDGFEDGRVVHHARRSELL
jgi:hypothetical protein